LGLPNKGGKNVSDKKQERIGARLFGSTNCRNWLYRFLDFTNDRQLHRIKALKGGKK